MQLRELVEEAARRQGSHELLAAALGVKPSRVSEWKNPDHRPCPIEVQARIAELAGQDPKAWVWGVVKARMGKALRATATLGVVAMLAYGVAVLAQLAAGSGLSAAMYRPSRR